MSGEGGTPPQRVEGVERQALAALQEGDLARMRRLLEQLDAAQQRTFSVRLKVLRAELEGMKWRRFLNLPRGRRP